MIKSVSGEIVSIGTELLRGEIVDTNAVYISSQLPLAGIELQRITTAGDDLKQLAQIIRQAITRAAVVITTGGLGPTQDDLTREAVALVLDETLYRDAGLATELKETFARMGREMPFSNLNQAMLIPSAKSLPNPKGTAPGWWVEKNGKVIVLMPGPPNEMRPMWENEVFPRLKIRFPGGNIQARTIKTFSMQEAKVGELCHELFETDNPITGIYAKPDGIQVRMIAQGDDAKTILDAAEMKVKKWLHPNIWGTDNETLEGIVGQTLSKRNMSLATIEDFTGGLIGTMITNSGVASSFYRGGMIVNASLTQGGVVVRNAVVSGEIAEAMALAVKKRFASDYGLSVTGVQQSRDAAAQADIVYIGVADDRGTKSWRQQFMINRADSRERAAVSALFHLRERLIETKVLILQ